MNTWIWTWLKPELTQDFLMMWTIMFPFHLSYYDLDFYNLKQDSSNIHVMME